MRVEWRILLTWLFLISGLSAFQGGPAGRGESLDSLMQWERADMGVAPAAELHSGQMHGPTPNSIPGGQVITTKGLIALMEKRAGLVFDVLGFSERLPGALPAVAAARPGSFNDQTQQTFGQFLRNVTHGRTDTPLVFYCRSPECWMSYNASLRAIRLGYRNVLWYRGGLDAWKRAGRATEPASEDDDDDLPVSTTPPLPPSGGMPAPAEPRSPPSSSPAAWREIRPNAGASLRVPAGWNSATGPRKSAIELIGPAGERLSILPVFITPEQKPPSPEAVLDALARKLAPAMPWQPATRLRASAVRMIARSAQATSQATLGYRITPKGIVGFVYLTSARADRYAAAMPVFQQILQSLRVTGAPASAPAAPARTLQYRTWTEPGMGAFSTQVPVGWNVKGGFRYITGLQAYMSVEASSPDGKMIAFWNDPQMPMPFLFPLAVPGALNQPNAQPYVPAPKYGELYAGNKMRQLGCQNGGIVRRQDLPLPQSAPGMAAQLSEVELRCELGGTLLRGGVRAATWAGGGIWGAFVIGCLGPADQYQTAQAACENVIFKVRFDPRFSQGQSDLTAQINGISRQSAAEVDSIILSHKGPSDERARRESNAMLDVTDVIDPQTGTRYKVDSTSDYYWIGNTGAIVGTNSPAMPDIDFREMIQLP